MTSGSGPILAFTLVALVLTLTPGADTLLVIRNTLRGGRTYGWATTVGITSGVLVHAVLSSVGLSVILARSAAAFEIVKLAGAAYLIVLGLQSILRARRDTDPTRGAGLPSRRLRHRTGFTEGLLTNLLNPKVAIFYLAFLPQFISPGDPVLARSVLLAGIHNLLGLLWLGGLAATVARSRVWLARPSVSRWTGWISGSILAGLGVRLALEKP